VCVILSLCLSYLILRLLVSPRLQQELHSCGLTIARGHNESCEVTLYKDRGRKGAHTIVAEKRRTRGVEKEDEKIKVRQVKACMCVGECLRAHVRLGARAGTRQKLQSGK